MTEPTTKSSRGRPRLRAGEATIVRKVKLASADDGLIADAAHVAGEHVTTYMRGAAVVRACEELGLDPLAWIERGERVPVRRRTRAKS